MHIWQDIFCSVICAFYCEYGDGTEDVAVVIKTFFFIRKGFFYCEKEISCFDADFQGRVSSFNLMDVHLDDVCLDGQLFRRTKILPRILWDCPFQVHRTKVVTDAVNIHNGRFWLTRIKNSWSCFVYIHFIPSYSKHRCVDGLFSHTKYSKSIKFWLGDGRGRLESPLDYNSRSQQMHQRFDQMQMHRWLHIVFLRQSPIRMFFIVQMSLPQVKLSTYKSYRHLAHKNAPSHLWLFVCKF